MANEIEPEETKTNVEVEDEKLMAEAKALGVTRSKVKTSGFSIKGKTPPPDVLAKEQKRHEKLADKRFKARVEQARIDAKKKPIEKRKELLVGRFNAIKSRTRAHTYSDANITAWTEEYNMIINNPKSWNKITNKGTTSFIPGNKKKKSAREILDGMDLD